MKGINGTFIGHFKSQIYPMDIEGMSIGSRKKKQKELILSHIRMGLLWDIRWMSQGRYGISQENVQGTLYGSEHPGTIRQFRTSLEICAIWANKYYHPAFAV